jgi:hypothetical protein
MTRLRGDRPSLTLEQRRERFWRKERRDFEKYSRLTARQRRSPYWLERKLQWESAAKLGVILHLAGAEQLPEPLARALAPSPPIGSPSGLFASPPAKKER